MSLAKAKPREKPPKGVQFVAPGPRALDRTHFPPPTPTQRRRNRSRSRLLPKRNPVEIVHDLKKLSCIDETDNEEEYLRWSHAIKPVTEFKPITTLEELKQLHLSRHRIEHLLSRPAFKDALQSCFVRVNINGEEQLPEYRIAEIMNVQELKLGYYVGNVATNVVLQLRYDDRVMQHDINALSNMDFTQEEFAVWRDNLVGQAIEPPSTELIGRKKIELYNALNCENKHGTYSAKSWVMPLRPMPKGGIMQRRGTPYPWHLEHPPPPMAMPLLFSDQLDAAELLDLLERPIECSSEMEKSSAMEPSNDSESGN